VEQQSSPSGDRANGLTQVRDRVQNLPRQLTRFVGRERELAEIKGLLAETTCSLLSLVGPGGIGKTRLAVQVASEMSEAFADGVYFVDLNAVQSVTFLVSAMMDALNPPSLAHEGQEALLNYLRDKEMLWVLDSFDQCLAGGGEMLLTAILSAVPGVKFLVTSREALNLQEEWLFHVPGLPFPESGRGDDLEAYAAVQLFVERARRVRRGFSPVDEQEGVLRICQLVEGMPLAIELAASWVKTLKCMAIADEIQRNLDFLTTHLRNVPQRHRSMRAALDYSWKSLTPEEQTVFSRLAVFRGGFRRHAAEQVAGASLVTLSTFVDKSLLRWEPDGRRYKVHELLRQYAQEQLEGTAEEADRVRDLHCIYYTDFIHERTADIQGIEQQGAVREIAAEIENVRTAWRWAIEKEKVEAIQKSAVTLQLFYDLQGHFLESATAFEMAVESLDRLQPDPATAFSLAHVLLQLGWIYIRLGRLEEAEAVVARSREFYHELDRLPPPGFATDPLIALGILANIRGDYGEATGLAHEARRLHETRADNHNLQIVFYVLANAAFAQGEYQAAQDHAWRAYAVTQATGNRWFMAYVVSELGHVARTLGDYDQACQHYQASYAIKEELDDPEGMAVALNHLAKTESLQGNYQGARELFQRSLAIYREINDRGGLAASLNGLGDTARALGDLSAAGQYLHEALQITTEMQFTSLSLAVLTGLGELLLDAGRPEQAAELLSCALHHPASDQETRDRALACLARVQANLAPEPLAAALDRGQAGDLNSLAAQWLLELAETGLQGVVPSRSADSRAPGSGQPLVEPLTGRELEVLHLIAAGQSNQHIADRLIISLGTVKYYTAQIYGKLGVHNRTQAVARARELALLP
jgi:predicted ATPase/DNA-binding CsgD family transcriptional regulator